MKAHPGAEVICRDRAGAYAEGAKTGAPGAIHVADRWHLWRNLGEYVEKAVVRHRVCLKEDNPPPATSAGSPRPCRQPQPPAAQMPEAAQAEPAAPREPHCEPEGLLDVFGRERRLVVRTRERYTAVQSLLAEGYSLAAIGRRLHLDHSTVRRFARAADVEELLVKATGRATKLDRYKPYLRQRLAQGITDAAQLTAEITAMGYTGSDQTLYRYLRPLRPATGSTSRTKAPPAPRAPAPPAARTITGWLLRHPDSLDDEDKEQLKTARTRCEHLDRLAGHVNDFAQMMTKRRGEQELEGWLAKVEADDIAELRSFATGIRRDQAAVTNGLTLPHSNGATEGNLNRLKALKRQMYGRAGLDLLRKRVVLHAAQP